MNNDNFPYTDPELFVDSADRAAIASTQPNDGESQPESAADQGTRSPAELELPVLPLKSSVLFPKLMMPLVVGREASVAAVEAAASTEDKQLIVVSQKQEETAEPTLDDLFHIGTRAVIRKLDRADGQVQMIVQGLERVVLLRATQQSPYLQARVRSLPPLEDTSTEVEALHRAIIEQAGRILELISPQAQAGLSQVIAQFKDPLDQVYLMGSLLPIEIEKEQSLLAAGSRVEALRLMHSFISHEAQVLELRHKIATQAQTEMSREQREYLLRQQMRAIQEELGEQNPEQAELDELRRRMEEVALPESVRKDVTRELDRLARIPAASPDHQVTRTYLELILELPWQTATEDVLDLPHAQQVLDEDHYDLKEIKERIIEHLAVMKLNPAAKSPILCFVGPPGVGKTSLGQSIARALGRKFERMSLGGLHDEAELRGHRRTYIGAMPGRVIEALRRAGVNNPVVMLDEVDKVGRDFRGDPTSALLEILDPAQNHEFRDNYLDQPFDLSNVFFIATANTLDTIQQPLLDRMEILRLSGYTDEEKLHIARRYLVPRQLREVGLTDEQLTLPDDTLRHAISRYTREAGVRELERTIGRLCRKIATRFAGGSTEPVTVAPEELTELLGRERFFHEDARRELPPGVAAGMAYTPVGGEVLYIEAVALPGSGELMLTGKLGDVMKESAQAARSFIRSWAASHGVPEEKLKTGLHIHVPAGATPKDGPSAGVTMATALASVFTGVAVPSDLAMTGEITLSGLVLPVGGIKEKVLAAHRAGMRRIILPKRNEADLEELPDDVRESIRFEFAERIEDVL
ncbi:MAG: endopeptidase La, partial [Planctomycetales bacterium]|nr:endopeptidase La [Planctomycetales bacterium]